jgi:TonB-dependent SusC/RagA subfamily outer membrane receptor
MKKIYDLIGSAKTPEMEKTFRKMKLTSFFLLISVVSVMAGKTYSQTTLLNLNMGKTTVREVLLKIEDQSEFYFMYSGKVIDVNREVSVDVKNQKINEVLNSLFAGTNVDYTIKDRIIVLTTPEVVSSEVLANFQQRTVSGKVTDTNNQPLPGVTVVIKGTTQGTVTNGDGTYTISNIPDNATLHFSFVGLKAQDVLIGNQTTINVSMEDETIGIEEVVAVGYGTQKKSNLTSSISKLSDEAIKERPITNVGEALQGQLAGVRAQASAGGVPGREMTIRIRGMNTINGSSDPLYVIDGVPRDNMNDINPNDIASIQILKDASASSIYGSRGGNGVVLIETKRGKGKPTVTFEGYYGISNSEKKLDLMNGE